MNKESILFLSLTLFSIVFQAFFSMMEMACVSFNRVRLQYYVSKGLKKAVWLSSLLNHPTRFFGTTLLCINVALQFGSECSRRFYAALGLSPDWAPISQIILVVIFAELAPLFAARSYAEHVALLGIRVLYFFSLLMRPFVWLIESLLKFIQFVVGATPRKYSFLTKDELQRAIEARGDKSKHGRKSEFDVWIASLFSAKNKIVKDFMIPLKDVHMVSGDSTALEVRKEMKKKYHHYFPVYQKDRHHIIGVVSPRDMLRLHDYEPIHICIKTPWFIPMKSSLLQIIREFRWNNQEIAIVVDEQGKAIGMINLDHTIAEVLPETRSEQISTQTSLDKTHILLDRSFPSSAKVADICERYQIDIQSRNKEQTLEALFEDVLKHPPGMDEVIIIGDFELKVVQSPFMGEKMINIRSL
ncbi:MAG: hemolysin family protein [Simkaniaceae bacterium]|nr:hemolysin family protein [Simkaniaceae bacterium]